MIEIVIPTLGRCDNQITLSNIPEAFHSNVTLVVQSHEYDVMTEKYPSVNVWQLPENTKGIALTRKEVAKNWKGNRIWVMDDDLKFVKLNSELKAHVPDDEEWKFLFSEIERFMSEGYVHGALQTHNTPPSPEPYAFNTRMYTNVFYSDKFDPDSVNWGESYELMPEDFYVNLQLLTTGFQNVVFQHYRVSPSATNSKGGCETFRTIDNHNRGQEILGELFPDFVDVYEKEQTSGPWKGQVKKALKIKWKKAYESSKIDSASLEDFF